MRLKKASVHATYFFTVLLIAFSCTSERDTPTPPDQSSSALKSQESKSTEATNTAPSRPQSDSIFAQIDNQMTVVELRQKLEEVKAIEREARRMVVLRRNWMVGVSECMRILERLKPKAAAIRDDYQRMLSLAGMNISSAAMNLVGCINCVENDDDDCSYARDFISKAERELKKEMRHK